MADFKDRLEEALFRKDMTPAELSRATGIGEGAISQYRKGSYKASQRNLERISSALGVPIPWLMGLDDESIAKSKAKNALSEAVADEPTMPSGKRLGKLFEVSDFDFDIFCFNQSIEESDLNSWIEDNVIPPRPVVDKILKIFEISANELFSSSEIPLYLFGLKGNGSSAQLPDNIQPFPEMRRWKVLGSTACGSPMFKEAEDETVLAPAHIDADFVFHCEGDSMIGARIMDGDIVFVKSGEEIGNGQIGVVRVGEEYSLKRIYRGPDYLELRSENPKYPPIVIRGEQENAEIVGKAVHFISRVI